MPRLKPGSEPPLLQDVVRRFRIVNYRIVRFLPLSQRFLLAAVIVVALAMIVLGNWIGYYLQASITTGVTASTAASIDSLIAHALEGVSETRPLTAEDRTKLDDVFEIGNDADSTRLLQIRVLNPDGSVLYESSGGLIDDVQTEDLLAAARGGAVSSIANLPIEPVGPIAGHSIAVLKIYTPLHGAITEEVFAVAALYYSAKSLLAIQFRAQLDVWVLVGLIGLGVIGVLYVLVDRASRTIASQRARLATNLTASRRLSEENRVLHAASEQLRLNANFANESLLAQVGSDIHDGPIQLLTLIILRLTKATGAVLKGKPRQPPDLAATIQLATDAMEELRNISAGLVLPELANISVADSIHLAISRHEEATGSAVQRDLRSLPEKTSMAVKICAYRIVQEALTNAFRHAGASNQSVSASAKNGSLFIAISNPAQFARAQRASDGGTLKLGLRGMRFRVESLGGVLRADIGTSSVTTISAEIPYGVTSG